MNGVQANCTLSDLTYNSEYWVEVERRGVTSRRLWFQTPACFGQLDDDFRRCRHQPADSRLAPTVDKGIYTLATHCLEWYKLVLRTCLPTPAISSAVSSTRLQTAPVIVTNIKSNLAKSGIVDRRCHLVNHKASFIIRRKIACFGLRFNFQICSFHGGSKSPLELI